MLEKTTEYFLISEALKTGSAVVFNLPDINEPFDDIWLDGIRIEGDVPEPFVYTFKAGYRHSYYSECYPVMSDKLVDALVRAGVDNIDTYNAIFYQEGSDDPITDYKVINIVGVVSAVDEGASNAISLGIGHGGMSPRFFTKLKVSDKKTNNLLLFRFAERVSQIAIHRSVK